MSSSELIEDCKHYANRATTRAEEVCWQNVIAQLTTLEQRVKELEQQLDCANKASGFCEKHLPYGGARNCLVCGCEKLSFALDKISYICGEPNEHGLSEYGNHFDEEVVIKQVTAIILSLGAKDEALKNVKNELGVPQPGYPAPVANTFDIANNALSTTPNDLWQRVVTVCKTVNEVIDHHQGHGTPTISDRALCYFLLNENKELLILLGATK